MFDYLILQSPANAAQLSNEYNKMWVNHYNSIVEQYKPEDVLFVRYEDLRNENTRVDTMRTVTDFLKVGGWCYCLYDTTHLILLPFGQNQNVQNKI